MARFELRAKRTGFATATARREATQIVRDLLQEADETGHDWHGWEVQVLDADQRLVCVIPFDSS
jgi:hypothetical protein